MLIFEAPQKEVVQERVGRERGSATQQGDKLEGLFLCSHNPNEIHAFPIAVEKKHSSLMFPNLVTA